MLILLNACALYWTRFSPPFKQEARVILKEDDFQYIERDIKGEYSYWSIYLFGFYPFFPGLEIPLADPRLFSQALANLYSNTKQQTVGKSTQMINWTLDANNYFIPIPYITPVKKTAIFRSDLIEYTK